MFAIPKAAVAGVVMLVTAGLVVAPVTVASASGSTSPPVLNPIYDNAPTVDAAAVAAFEANAVNQVLQSHGLPSSDANAVLAWGREDVRAAEYTDLTQIVSESAAKRSGTGVLTGGQDQLVYNWMQGVIQQQKIAAAQQAINEFKRWSGLTSITTGASPVNFGPQQSFPGGFGDGAPVSTGFCGFLPPGGSSGPFAGAYSAANSEDCYIPCTDLITDCYPPEPDVAQFEQWGLYDSESKIFGTPDFMPTGAGAAIAEGAGIAAAIAGFTTPITVGIKAGPLLSRFVAEVAPFAVKTIARAATAIVAAGAAAAAEAGTVATETVTEVVAAATGALSASLVLGIVGVVIDFIISTVLAGITLNQQLTEPGQLQQVLTDAQSTPPDLTALISTTGGANELFAAFISTTVPESQTQCSLISNDPCFTPPTPPVHTGADPSFLITPASGGTGTIQSSIYTVNPLGLFFNKTYMSGNGWFVSQHFDAFDSANATVATNGGATVQSLSFQYVDWSGNHWSAERLTDASSNVRFALTPLDDANKGACTALPNGTSPCLTDSLQVEVPGSQGIPFDATVKMVSAATLAPTVSVAYATPGVSGQAITFTPHASDPSSLPLTYTWAFPVSGNQGCVLDASNTYCGFHTSSGGATSWTFHAPGDYELRSWRVTQTTTPLLRRSMFSSVAPTTTAIVSSAAPAVSTQPVTFTTTVTPSGGGGCVNAYFGPAVTGDVQFLVDGAKFGHPVELTPSCAGAENTGGAGTASITVPNLAISAPGHTVTAQYLGNPVYTASSKSLSQVVTPETDTITITPSVTPIVFGQPVSFHAAIAPVAPGSGRPTGTVQFSIEGNALGAPVALGTNGVATSLPTSALSVDQFELGPFADVQAVYSGDTKFPGGTSSYKENVKSDPAKTTVTSSVNPSALGEPVSYTATVTGTAPGGGTPYGCVQFAVDGTNTGAPVFLNAGTATSAPISSLTLTGAGTAHVQGHAITAQYLGSDSTCQDVFLNPQYVGGLGTLAPGQSVLASGTPTVTGATAPTTLSGSPFKFTFYKPVKHVDGTGKTNVNVTAVGQTTPIVATIVCKNAKLATVSCASGPVSTALLMPKLPLIAGTQYLVNVDKAGAAVVGSVGGLKVPGYQGHVRAQSVFTAAQYPVVISWGTLKNPVALGGSYLQDQWGGSNVVTAFTLKSKSSPSVVLIKGPSQGIAVITVYRGTTQVSTRQLDTYSATLSRLVTKLGTLAAGKYSVKISVQGSKNSKSTGAAIGFDAVIANGVTTATPVVTANWASIPDGFGGNYVFTTQPGAAVSLPFHGTGIAITALIGPNDGEAQVVVDGKVIATQDQYASNYAWHTFIYGGLTNANHTVNLKVLGVKDGASSDKVVTFDGISIP